MESPIPVTQRLATRIASHRRWVVLAMLVNVYVIAPSLPRSSSSGRNSAPLPPRMLTRRTSPRARASRRPSILFRPGQSSCLTIPQFVTALRMRSTTGRLICTPVDCG